MNWLRKIGNWIWLNKERMVLAVMVGILIFRVYQVLNPETENQRSQGFTYPDKEPPDDISVPIPPAIPRDPQIEDWSRLWRFSPFIYRPPRGGASSLDANDIESRLDLELEQIKDIGNGTYRAKIRTSSRATWYEVNEQFEQFTLMSIDVDAGCVVIFSEQESGNIEKCISATP